ncbi:TonB-dependent receptor [Parasphingopyxis marina]|uniref:TonB-dependent receptor n=1 Tax=Parasphingopyxis marina TaxID=2761622 RepID=A0A842HU10_9SPHN|nr:TonB-dependent receptor [Parasphingopyxis marina]MBC2776566.1 TonB-dependent receptor [Parasphingopyxis marina]
MNHSSHSRAVRYLAGIALAPLALALPGAAQAQTGAQTAGENAPIIVSARRRDESLIDVPLSVTAISGESLSQSGALDITEIAESVPNVTFEVSRGTNTTLTTFIRGVGQQDPVAGFENGVGLYVDDVYYNRPQAAVLDIFDVERVEVLRGPQGTLYGRNTIGGAVKFVTRRLADSPTGEARFNAGTYGQFDGIGSVALPIGDSGFYIGGSAALLTRNGFGENINLGIENYDKDVFAARGTLEYAPNSDIFVRVTGDYTDDRSNPRQGHRLIPGLVSGAPVLDNVYDTRAGLQNPEQRVEAWGVSGTIELQVSDTVRLRNILAYRDDQSSTPIDFDSLPAADLDVPAIYANDQFSEEFQIVYEDDNLAGLIGFYYLDASAFTNFDVILATTGAVIPPPNGPLPGLTAKTLGDVDTETWSIFGDFTWDITDQWSLSVGGRYTHDERRSRVLRTSMIFGPSPEFGGDGIVFATTSDFDGSATFKEFTPRASISFQPTPDHNIYLSYSRGFKGGGFDPRGQTSQAPDLDGDGDIDAADIYEFMSFDPEIVDSFELGYHGSLANGAVTVSLAGFYADYTDIQIPGSVGADTDNDGVNDTFIGITSNAGAATIWGVEFEGRARVGRDLAASGDRLGFNWAAGYINAEYDEFIDAFGNDVADQRVFQNTPEWTLSGTLDYGIPAFGGELNFLTTLSYRSETNQFEVPSDLDQSAYALWDASLVWTSDDDHWQLGVHAKNITDHRYIVSGYNFVAPNGAGGYVPTLGLEGTLTAFYGDPFRTFVSARMRF